MIGIPVSADEFGRLLARQAERDKFAKQMEDELKAIKPGKCLLYASRPDTPLWVRVAFNLLFNRIKGLTMIEEDNRTYVYREG